MSDTPPSVDAVKAAQVVEPIPDPVLEGEEIAELEDLPEGKDEFPREYVETLRTENAKWRTRTRDIESHFEGYTEQERTRFLEMARTLQEDPEAALEDYEGVTDRLRKQLGKEVTVPEETETAPVVKKEETPTALTEDDITRLVGERMEVERVERVKAEGIQATLDEAEALGDGEQYKNPAAKAQLFATAQHQQISLAEAHDLLTGDFSTAVDAAVEARLESIRTGKVYPPRLPAGDPSNVQDKGPPKTLEEAQKSSEARFAAAYGQ